MTTAEQYDPATSLDTYYTDRSQRREARLWTAEKLALDLDHLGIISLFVGGGSDPTGLAGYDSGKLWLNVEPGVTTESGALRQYDGSGDPSLLVSWPAVEYNATPLGALAARVVKQERVDATLADIGSADIGAAASAVLATLSASVGGRLRIPPGAYTATSPIIIPLVPDGGEIEIVMHGVKITASGGINILQRKLPNGSSISDADAIVGGRVVIRGGNIVGDGTSGQTGIYLEATYGSLLDGVMVTGCDVGFDLVFCMDALLTRCRGTLNTTTGFRLRHANGIWTSATVANSGCNHTSFSHCRDYSASGAQANYVIRATSGVAIRDCISEGSNPVNSIDYDDEGCTVDKMFICENLHAENTPSNAIFKFRGGGGGTMILRSIFSYAVTGFLDIETGMGQNNWVIEDVPYPGNYVDAFRIPLGSGGTTGASWYFRNWGQGSSSILDAAWWKSSRVPEDIVHVGREPGGNGYMIESPTLYLGNPSTPASSTLVLKAKTQFHEKAGYATGAAIGGSVIQSTSKSTGVTLNKLTGKITLHNASLASSTTVGFVLTNSFIQPADIVTVSLAYSNDVTPGAYLVSADGLRAGACNIYVRNITAGSLGQPVEINFAVFRGATS